MAYDKVWGDAFLVKMSQKGIPSHMVQCIQAWLSNCSKLERLIETRTKQDGVQLYASVDNGSSTTRTQSSLKSHTIDSSPLAFARPLSTAK